MGPTKFVFTSFITPSAPSSSLTPYVILPALLTRTSIRPHIARASFMHFFISPIGEVTSRVRHLNLVPSTLGSRRSRSKDFKDRAVAIAQSPRARIERVSAKPSPADAPVTNQTLVMLLTMMMSIAYRKDANCVVGKSPLDWRGLYILRMANTGTPA